MDALDMARALEAVYQHSDGGKVMNVSVLVEHDDGSIVVYTANESLEVVSVVVTSEQKVMDFAPSGDGLAIIEGE